MASTRPLGTPTALAIEAQARKARADFRRECADHGIPDEIRDSILDSHLWCIWAAPATLKARLMAGCDYLEDHLDDNRAWLLFEALLRAYVICEPVARDMLPRLYPHWYTESEDSTPGRSNRRKRTATRVEPTLALKPKGR